MFLTSDNLELKNLCFGRVCAWAELYATITPCVDMSTLFQHPACRIASDRAGSCRIVLGSNYAYKVIFFSNRFAADRCNWACKLPDGCSLKSCVRPSRSGIRARKYACSASVTGLSGAQCSVCSGSIVVTTLDSWTQRFPVQVRSGCQYSMRLDRLHRAYPSLHPFGVVHSVPVAVEHARQRLGVNRMGSCKFELMVRSLKSCV